MIYMANFNLKEKKAGEFQKFIQDNEKSISENAPNGWKYMGTYFYVLGFGSYTCAALWECSKYGDLDTWREHSNPDWINLNKKFLEFVDETVTPSWLLREIGDTKVTEPDN